MMKTFAYLFVFFVIQNSPAENPGGKSPSVIDLPSTLENPSPSFLAAKKLIDEEIIKAFDEVHLGYEELSENRPSFRIFIGLGGKRPTLLKWYIPNKNDPGSIVEGKQLEKDENGWKILEKKSTRISEAQLRLLEMTLNEVEIKTLPNKDWSSGGLGGVRWFYEIPVSEGYIFFNRWSPLGVVGEDVYEGEKVAHDRLVREGRLTALTLMLWMISGLGPDHP